MTETLATANMKVSDVLDTLQQMLTDGVISNDMIVYPSASSPGAWEIFDPSLQPTTPLILVGAAKGIDGRARLYWVASDIVAHTMQTALRISVEI